MMANIFHKVESNKYVIWGAKIFFSLCIMLFIFQSLFMDGLNPYYSYQDYDYQNDSLQDSSDQLESTVNVSQPFVAKGNILNNISIYLTDTPNQKITITILDSSGEEVKSTKVNLRDYISEDWNQVALNCKNLKRNEQYDIVFSSEENLEAVKFQFSYRYMTLGSFFELFLKIVFSILIGIALCYAICRMEILYNSFVKVEKRTGIWYAIYFAVSFVLLYNPLETVRNEMTEFDRAIGIGIIENIDVSKRISNFNHWFVLFAIAFVLFYLLANYLLHKQWGTENTRIISFLDDFMVLANCTLLLRCITYFYDESISGSVYYFSSYVVMLVIFTALAYIAFELENSISVNEFAKLVLISVAISYPFTIFIALEWGNGKVLLGVMFFCLIFMLLFCQFGKKFFDLDIYTYISTGAVLVLSLLPVMTSVYIELVHVLNQYSVFVAHPAKYYKIAVLLVLIVCIAFILLSIKRKWVIPSWKRLVYPWFVFGIACLSVQLPIQVIYSPDIVEGANYSVLISDFLNYGTIPLVEHYGGHMMTAVWEGILYGLINNDYAGAVVSPYSSLFSIVLVVLFFYFIKNIWNEDMALFVALLFPFYSFWEYYGLGMLVCLAAMAYVRKNSYSRAVLVWLSFIWCALYRLDLGFAFGMAVIVSLLIYVIVQKNWKALKELGLTLLGCGLTGIAAWFIICIRKGINPVKRLMEFLLLNLSNQNWAYTNIGNTENTVFAWSYLVIPFIMIVCLLYIVFSKEMRKHLGNEKWVLLLILGFSYVANFSRGLVRHSLAEGRIGTIIVAWCSYLFLAFALSSFKDNKKLFLPAFMVLMVCDTLFVQIFLQNSNFTVSSIADRSVSTPGTIIESWTLGRFDDEEWVIENDMSVMTYWEKLKYDKQVVNRIQLDGALQNMIDSYEIVLNTLLEDDETYVDFINKTLVYSIIGRRDPVYVSQSPLQLSGEFAQEQFVEQISEVPVVLMPIDADKYPLSSVLDRVSNAYRNYKVAEYIYQNYVPLCNYGRMYAVWCLPDKYEEYRLKLESLVAGVNYLSGLTTCEDLGLDQITLSENSDGTVTAVANGDDPKIIELQNLIDLSSYAGQHILIKLEYSTNTTGNMQLFYTTEAEETYTGDKVVTNEINSSGRADFLIPVTEYSRMRLDIPEGSRIIISSLNICPADYIDYGYDGPIEKIDADGTITYDYMNVLHNYSLSYLPKIWAEGDKKSAISNAVIADLQYEDGFYTFKSANITPDEKGNYLKITASYDGMDTTGLHDDDDEYLDVVIILGDYRNKKFIEKCRYTLKMQEGNHDYLLRVSADYYWYLGEINAVKIQTDRVHNVDMQILEGD